uniref:GG10809 n=1 Tax=Drosophila erecta TaxID=7220 RepID=B3P4X4_DROER
MQLERELRSTFDGYPFAESRKAVSSKKPDSSEQPNTRTSRQDQDLKQSPLTMEALPRPLMAMVTVTVTVMLMPL